ncbi:MAG: hypothetical protein AAB583_06655 [Patescibacteria group bacterium]
MARIKIKQEFRLQLSEKLMDLGNLVAAALIIGQFISDREFSVTLFIIGMILAIILYLASYIVSF